MGRKKKVTPEKAPPREKKTKTPEKKKKKKKEEEEEVEEVEEKEKDFSCHHCHQKHPESKTNICSNCDIKFGVDCLKNSYKEKAVPKKKLSTWTCPRCRECCKCYICQKIQPLKKEAANLTAENLILRDTINCLNARLSSKDNDCEFLRGLVSDFSRSKQKEVANLTAENLILRDTINCLNATLSSRDNDCKFLRGLVSDFSRSKQGEEQDRERLRFENKELEKQLKAARLQAEAEAAEEALRNAELAAAAEAKRKREFEREAGCQDLILQKMKHSEDLAQRMSVLDESLKAVRMVFLSIKQDVEKMQRFCSEEINQFGLKTRGLVEAARSYHKILEENRKLHQEVQDLKGNIRVFCRVRPVQMGENQNMMDIECFADGELVVKSPLKRFKFTRVFGPQATQEEVYADTRPLIKSVMDGFDVCIFAYGQTGSGKTYSMVGPNASQVSNKDRGVSHRALHDIFEIREERRFTCKYTIQVQYYEIYNEKRRDLLIPKEKETSVLEILSPGGKFQEPEPTLVEVTSMIDVLDLVRIGSSRRAVAATAFNETSSRSHSILSVHVRGTDMQADAVLCGHLNLADLAGSEAVGDRPQETRHINRSILNLGNVLRALKDKSPHVPYNASALTKYLKSSFEGHAKTLMFVHVNPTSPSETMNSLWFAHHVAGVELGAARRNKEEATSQRPAQSLQGQRLGTPAVTKGSCVTKKSKFKC